MTVKKRVFRRRLLRHGDEANGKLWRSATAPHLHHQHHLHRRLHRRRLFVRLQPFYTCAPRAKHRDNERRHADKTATTAGGRSFAVSMAIRRDLQVDRCYSSSRSPLPASSSTFAEQHHPQPPPRQPRERSPTPRVLIK